MTGFVEVSQNEMMVVDGGWTWTELGLAAAGGALTGAMASTVTAGATLGPSALLGACVAVVAKIIDDPYYRGGNSDENNSTPSENVTPTGPYKPC